jgi:hypothetical protein
MVSRLLLESGEKVFIKVLAEPTLFVGVWRLGSLNPLTVVADWVISKFTGVRTSSPRITTVVPESFPKD